MLKVAVIGVGVMGRNHARNIANMPDVKLVGVCDVNEEAGKQVAKDFNTQYFSSYSDLITNEKPDAVTIVVPTVFHKEVALEFIRNGIHLLVEKPIAANSRDAQDIVDAAAKAGLVLQVGHIERYNPVISMLHMVINNGELGDILSISSKRVGTLPPRIKDVNVVTDIAVHDLDIIRSILGRIPESVYARGSGALIKGREDHAEIMLDYGHFGCFVQVNWITPIKIRTLSITGTKGHVELNFITQKLELYRMKYDFATPAKEFEEFVIKFGEPDKMELSASGDEPLALELRNFLNAVKGVEPPHVTGADGVVAVQLSEMILDSLHNGKIVRTADFANVPSTLKKAKAVKRTVTHSSL